MNSRTSPTSAQGGRALPVATPISLVTPGWPALLPPFCLWGSSSLPLLPPFSPPLPGPWDGRSRGRVVWGGIRLGGRMEEGRLSAGCELQREPQGSGNSWKCGCRVGREQAEPEKAREVGWGKGKGGNWIRRAALPKGPLFLRVFWVITGLAATVLSLRKERCESLGIDERRTFRVTPSQFGIGREEKA